MFIHFDTVPVCDGWTDRGRDRNVIANTACSIAEGCNKILYVGCVMYGSVDQKRALIGQYDICLAKDTMLRQMPETATKMTASRYRICNFLSEFHSHYISVLY